MADVDAKAGYSTRAVVLWLIFFFPVGVVLIFKSRWSTRTRVIVVGVLVVAGGVGGIVNLLTPPPAPEFASIEVTGPEKVTAGAAVSLTFSIRNAGPPIEDLTILFVRGDSWIDHTKGPREGCNESFGSLDCGPVGRGESKTFTVKAIAKDAGTWRITPDFVDVLSTRNSKQLPIQRVGGGELAVAFQQTFDALPPPAPTAPPKPTVALDKAGSGSETTDEFKVNKDHGFVLEYSLDCSNLGPGHGDLFEITLLHPHNDFVAGAGFIGRHRFGGGTVESKTDIVKSIGVTADKLSSKFTIAKSGNLFFQPSYIVDINTLCNWHVKATEQT